MRSAGGADVSAPKWDAVVSRNFSVIAFRGSSNVDPVAGWSTRNATGIASVSSFLSSVRNLVEFLEDHSGAIVSLAMIVIAAFTVASAWITERLAKLASSSINLGRAQFIATQRPKVITRGFKSYPSDPQSNQKPVLRFIFVNVGNTPATVVSIGAVVTDRSDPDLTDAERLLDPPLKLGSGQQRIWIVDPGDLLFGMIGPFCVGCITYKDALGHTRETGFCRKFDTSNGRWIRQTDSEYEYAD